MLLGLDCIENVLDRGVVDATIASGAPNFLAFLGGEESPNKSSNFIDGTLVALPKREGVEIPEPELEPVDLNEVPELLRLCLNSEGLVKLDDFLRLYSILATTSRLPEKERGLISILSKAPRSHPWKIRCRSSTRGAGA